MRQRPQFSSAPAWQLTVLVDRVNFFRERLEENGGEALEIGAIQELITW